MAVAKESQASSVIEDMSGFYGFLGPHDTLAILEEEGSLKGYLDVFQAPEESDDILSYQIRLGTRQKERVEFKTGTIHAKYYRFAGTIERGKGRNENDDDYLRLVGVLSTIMVESDTGKETAQQQDVILKWKPRTEVPKEE